MQRLFAPPYVSLAQGLLSFMSYFLNHHLPQARCDSVSTRTGLALQLTFQNSSSTGTHSASQVPNESRSFSHSTEQDIKASFIFVGGYTGITLKYALCR